MFAIRRENAAHVIGRRLNEGNQFLVTVQISVVNILRVALFCTMKKR